MGHVRLGTLPDTRPWRTVVGHLADGESAAVVAAATSAAAVDGLDRAVGDPGVARVVHLLAHTALAARGPDLPAALAAAGLHVPPAPTLFDLTAAFTEAVRRWYDAAGAHRSDVADLAEMAAVETLARLLGRATRRLFPSPDDVRREARRLATQGGFAALAHEFFARYAHRFLMYHLGRELPRHVGGNGRFPTRAAHAAFVADLDQHCRQAALIVRDFAAGWYKKTALRDGVTERQTAGFAAHAMTKLRGELDRRGAARVG